MDSLAVIRRLHQHRSWSNHQLADSAARLSDEQLRREFAIGQGSIWRSLTHLYASEFVWLGALEGAEDPLVPGDIRGRLPGNQEADGAATSMAELQARWTQLDQRWSQFLSDLTPDKLDEVIYKYSTSSGRGKRHATSCADILMHICTHAQYTTAQVLNMLRQTGVSPLPDVMLITLARQERGPLE